MKYDDLDKFNEELENTPVEEQTHFQKVVSAKRKEDKKSIDTTKEAESIYNDFKNKKINGFEMKQILDGLKIVQEIQLKEEERANKFKEMKVVEPVKIEIAGSDTEQEKQKNRIADLEKEVKEEIGFSDTKA